MKRSTWQIGSFLALALTSGLCGASPQEGRVPRPVSRPPVDTPPQQAFPHSNAPEGRVAMPGPEGRVGVRGPEGRVGMPGPQRLVDGPSRPAPEGRVARLRSNAPIDFFTGTRVVVPPAWPRCTILPNAGYWQGRDIMAEIQWLSRTGLIPVTPIGVGVTSISDYAMFPAGWRAYGVAVPAGGRIQVEVHHPKIAWFRLMAVNKWGQPGPGMLHAAMAYRPVMVTLTNPGKEATAMYIIVDDPGWWSDKNDPYTLTFRRDWDPLKVDLSHVQMVSGLWGASPSVSAQFSGPSLSGPAVYPY